MRPAKSLPNLLTLGNAFLGLLAISKAIDALVLGSDTGFSGLFETACWFILGAMLLDGLDGRVARMTDSFSDLGANSTPLRMRLLLGWLRRSWPRSCWNNTRCCIPG